MIGQRLSRLAHARTRDRRTSGGGDWRGGWQGGGWQGGWQDLAQGADAPALHDLRTELARIPREHLDPHVARELQVATAALDRALVGLDGAAERATTILDGRYRGGGLQVDVELRVDRGGAGVVSADLFHRAVTPPSWLASLRTAPDFEPPASLERLPVIVQDPAQRVALGWLDLTPTSYGGAEVLGVLRLEASLAGLPAGQPIRFEARFEGTALRRLGLEIETESGVEPPPEIVFDDQPMSLEIALANAGFETYTAGVPSRLPSAKLEGMTGWSEKDLEGLMRAFAQTSLDRPAFELRLLWLSKSNRPGLLGIMFDSEGGLQRQGLAVFADEIRDRFPASHRDRKLIQTTVHEIGHALNLVHRFERVVGRADSTSFMNYDWRYRGGNQSSEFWRRFAFSFDADEVAFLCHGPRTAVAPGGTPFHSEPYWAEWGGGYSPYVPEAPLPGIELELLPPTNGVVFMYGQPVLLGIRLTNRTGQTLRLPAFLLDQKAGFVELIVRRITGPAGGDPAPRSFTPILTRCFEIAEDTTTTVEPDETMEDNVNLVFGSAGFAFVEPGAYEIRALLVLYDARAERDLIAASPALRIRISGVHSLDEEQDALVLLRTDVGRYFALGGSGSHEFEDTKVALDAVLERRLGTRRARRKRGADRPSPQDAVAVNIVRCKAFRAARAHHALDRGTIEVHKSAKPAKALAHLERLDVRALAVFDPITARATAAFRSRLAAKPKN